MRICMFTDYYPPHTGGGVEKVVYELSRRLVDMGDEVAVVTLNTCQAPSYEYADGVYIHRASTLQLTRWIGAQSSISFQILPLTRRVLKEFAPDIVHAHNLYFWTAALAATLQPINGLPLVATVHVGTLHGVSGGVGLLAQAWERTAGRLILQRSTRVIALSNEVAQHALQLGAKAEQIELISNGVDVNAFTPRSSGMGGNRATNVIYVGRLIFNKGPQFLLEAVPAVLRHQPHASFLFVGDGPMRKKLEKRAERLGVCDSVRFLGVRHDVPDLLHTATVLVRPSLSEGMPLTVLEAMASGLPVIATPVGGTVELVKPKLTGLLVEPGNVSQLASSLVELLSRPEWGRAMGREGRNLVERKYTWDRVAEHTRAMYSDLVNGS